MIHLLCLVVWFWSNNDTMSFVLYKVLVDSSFNISYPSSHCPSTDNKQVQLIMKDSDATIFDDKAESVLSSKPRSKSYKITSDKDSLRVLLVDGYFTGVTFTFRLLNLKYTYCRFGIEFEDDEDAAEEVEYRG